MITVSTTQLVDEIREADAFKLPEMNAGTGYLYDTVYCRMAGGHSVSLSELNFDAFEREDVDSLHDLYTDVFERNYHLADRIAATLRAIVPVSKAVAYI
jgi:hypothetical protein